MLQEDLLLTARIRNEAAFVIVGGMAAVVQGAAYVTADLGSWAPLEIRGARCAGVPGGT